MASLCTRCALRLHRAAANASPSTTTPQTTRSLSTTLPKRKSLPTFTPASSPELDQILTSLHTKHIIPRLLPARERKLIFSMKSKQLLEDNPQTVTLGGQEIPLQWIDQRTEIPNRQQLITEALRLMDEGKPEDWRNLQPLLTGLHETKKTVNERQFAKAVRLASKNGQFATVLQCLTSSGKTGMTLKSDVVLQEVLWSLREDGRGREGGWEEEGLKKAIRHADLIARMMEDDKHGSGSFLKNNDPRQRPEVLAVFLELHAVYAVKHQEEKDVSGRVAAFAERLLSNMGDESVKQVTTGSERDLAGHIMQGVPQWHALSLAKRILGDRMPHRERAKRAIEEWEHLQTVASNLEAGDVQEGTYVAKALDVWRDRIREEAE